MFEAINDSIITAISTLAGVGITLYYTSRKEKSRFIQDLILKEYTDSESFYIDLITSIEKAKRFTESGTDYKDLFNESALMSAKANLIAPSSIRNQLDRVSDLLFDWSTYYRKGTPRKLDGTSMGMLSSIDMKFKDKADEIYPVLNAEIGKLIDLIKEELTKQKKGLRD